MAADKKPGDPSRGRPSHDRSGAPRGNKPQRNPGPRPGAPPQQRGAQSPPRGQNPAPAKPGSERHAPGAGRNGARPADKPTPKPMIDLPMAPGSEPVPEAAVDGMVYITYGEHGDDVAFELSADLKEALEILAQMRDDGFTAKLFQAQEIDVVVE